MGGYQFPGYRKLGGMRQLPNARQVKFTVVGVIAKAGKRRKDVRHEAQAVDT